MKIIKVDELMQGDEILLGSNSLLRRAIVKSVPKTTKNRSFGNYSSVKCDILNNDLEDYTVVRKNMYLDLNFRDILVIKSKNEEI